MPKPQFSIRVLLFVTFLVALTAWLSRRLPVNANTAQSPSVFAAFLLAAVLGPLGFAGGGFALGLESKTPWRGALIGMILGIIVWGLLFYTPAMATW